MVYPQHFEQKIGFDKIRTIITNKCITQTAKTLVEEMQFSDQHDEVINQLSITNEMKSITLESDGFPESGYVDVLHFLPKIKLEGNYLETYELFDLQKALTTCRLVVNFFKNREPDKYPALRQLCAAMEPMPHISNSIMAIITEHGKLKDNASSALQDIRREIRSKQTQVSRRMMSILKAAQAEGLVDDDVSIAIRDGRTVIPVSASNKRKVKGFVMGESATGRTVFIEPLEVVELNNEIKELEFAEQREIIRILIELTNSLRPYREDLVAMGLLLGQLDFIRAKASYAIDIQALMPVIESNLCINLSKAKHPLLLKTLEKEKKTLVPLDLSLNTQQHILLISGPNAGGKSVCLKTAGLLQYMLQCGLLVSVGPDSEMAVFEHIFIDIGDEQSIENDLSTYSSHLSNMKFFLKHANQRSLILIDEFGTGTEPTAGGAIAEAVLSELNAKRAFGLITTHYTNLKFFASSAPGIMNGAMLFDVQNIQPLFRLETGIPGSSFAFEIARKIGLPETIIKDAQARMGETQVGMEVSLREIARDKRYWEDKRSRIKNTDKHLEELTDKYEKELKELKEKRKSILEEAREEAKKLLVASNREIENTIRTIKESQADKEKTKQVRQHLDQFKAANVDNEVSKSATDTLINNKMRSIEERQKRRAEKKNQDSDSPLPHPTPIEIRVLQVGDKVKLKDQQTVGEIMKISDTNVAVALGHLIVNVKPDKVEYVSQQAFKKAMKENRAPSRPNADMSTKRLNFKPSLDVRGCRTLDALDQVTSFVDEALMLGVNHLSILHGKGTGALKMEIRVYLKTFGDLLVFGDAEEEAGGAGITQIEIKG